MAPVGAHGTHGAHEATEVGAALTQASFTPPPEPAAVPVRPAVTFGTSRRPEDATEVVLADWAGPLGLLLTLIEARRLDVLTVPLGALAGAYLEALATLEGDRITNVSSFVAVAGQLILIKSRVMLPRRDDPGEPGAMPDDGPDPEAELRERLILYRAYRDAGQALQDAAVVRHGLFRREPAAALAAAVAGARAPDAPPLDPTLLVGVLARLALVVAPPEPAPEMIRRSITLNQRAAILRAALRAAPSVVLQDLLRDVRDRVVVAVTFLALLELMKRREIVVEQAAPFGPITLRRATPEERSASGRADAGDDTDLDETMAGFR
ncbi:MAG: segregation/condensation protein A [Chloroflexi bacterium]|nr:segregation/condensation protein A [Chloroflexota bacterium]